MDRELKAMQQIVRVLDSLPLAAAKRVIGWCSDRLQEEPAQELPRDPAPISPEALGQAEG